MKKLLAIFLVLLMVSPAWGWWVVCDPPEVWETEDWVLTRMEYVLNDGEPIIFNLTREECPDPENPTPGCYIGNNLYIHDIATPWEVRTHKARFEYATNDAIEWTDYRGAPERPENLQVEINKTPEDPPPPPPPEKYYANDDFIQHAIENGVRVAFKMTIVEEDVDVVVGFYDAQMDNPGTSGSEFYNAMFMAVQVYNNQVNAMNGTGYSTMVPGATLGTYNIVMEIDYANSVYNVNIDGNDHGPFDFRGAADDMGFFALQTWQSPDNSVTIESVSVQ